MGEGAQGKSKPQQGLKQALLNPSSEAGQGEEQVCTQQGMAMLCLPGPAGEPKPPGLSLWSGAPGQPGGHSLADSLLQLNLVLLTGDLYRLEHCCFPIQNRNICEKGSFIINLQVLGRKKKILSPENNTAFIFLCGCPSPQHPGGWSREGWGLSSAPCNNSSA